MMEQASRAGNALVREYQVASDARYAAYGRAMAAAQLLEHALGLRLMTTLSETERRRGLRLTLGGLIRRLQSAGELPLEFADALEGALLARNVLAHEYFVDLARPPVEEEARHLRELQEVFEGLASELVPGVRYENREGDTYILHRRVVTLRGGRQQEVFFFSTKANVGTATAIPGGYVVVENPRTGTPLLKKS